MTTETRQFISAECVELAYRDQSNSSNPHSSEDHVRPVADGGGRGVLTPRTPYIKDIGIACYSYSANRGTCSGAA